MCKCSVISLLLLFMFVNGDARRVIGHNQSSPIIGNRIWKHEGHYLQDKLFTDRESRAVHGKEENAVSKEQDLWTLRRMKRSTDELQGVCACFNSNSTSSYACSYNIEEFVLIINGVCMNGTQRRRRRRAQYVSKNDVSSVAAPFLDTPLCDGARPLLLVSSGRKQTLHLKSVPSVWVCPLSLGASLHHLSITNVSEVEIAPRALAQRRTNFTFSLSGMWEKLVFPRGALSVDMLEMKNVPDVPNSHMEDTVEHHLPSLVKVVIKDANHVKFEKGSVVAPRVWIEVQHTESLEMETQAMTSLVSPIDSVLDVSSTQNLYMREHAVDLSSLRVTTVSYFLLMKESIVVMIPGGEVVLQDIKNVISYEKSILLGGEAVLDVSSVKFRFKSYIGIFSQTYLRSVVFRNVKFSGFNTTSICLATLDLSLLQVTGDSSEEFAAYACLRYFDLIESNTTDASGLVLCRLSNLQEARAGFHSCVDPRCQACVDPKTSMMSLKPSVFPLYETKGVISQDEGELWWEDPLYLCLATGPPIVLGLLLLLCYCIYKRSQNATYELPHPRRDERPSSTIITSENLGSHLHNNDVPEVFINHNRSENSSLQHQNRSHRPEICQPHFGLKSSEDRYSISSSEVTI